MSDNARVNKQRASYMPRRAAPRALKSGTKMVTVAIPEDVYDAVSRIAQALDATRAAVVEDILRGFITHADAATVEGLERMEQKRLAFEAERRAQRQALFGVVFEKTDTVKSP